MLVGVLLVIIGVAIWAMTGIPGTLGVIALAVGVISLITGSVRTARAANERDHVVTAAARKVASSGTDSDLAGQLTKLAELRRGGEISDDDYEKAKRQLLDPS